MTLRLTQLPLLAAFCLILGSCAGGPRPTSPPEKAPPPENPFLTHSPETLFQDGDVVLLRWEIPDRPDFSEPGPSGLPYLERWREGIRQRIGSRTDPAYLIKLNDKLYPWVTSGDAKLQEVDRLVASGKLGRWRPMNGIESFLLDYHASRYPLLERPSEMGVLILSRGSMLRVYYLTDGDGLAPKKGAKETIEGAAHDVQAGWVARTFLHNHTFEFEADKGHLAIPAPSLADLHFNRILGKKLGIDRAWIIDGFNAFELDAAQFDFHIE